MFLDGDTNAAVLRSGWGADALQLTSMTVVDHSADELFESRHNTENPLDLTLFAAGSMLLPTASGGPQVTSSANRAAYLEPASKNVPLVDDNAPYVVDPLRITFDERLDSSDAGGVTHRLLDTATTRVDAFQSGVDVERTVALVDDSFAVVVDRFLGVSAHDYALTWRGRGEPSVRSLASTHVAVDYAWPDALTPSAHLAIDVGASVALTPSIANGLYAPAWGVEEILEPLRVDANTALMTALSVMRPRADADAATTITPLGIGGTVAFRIEDGAVHHLVATRGGIPFVADGVGSDAELATVRRMEGWRTG